VLRSIFGPWIFANSWGTLFLVMRRWCSINSVGGFESKLKLWMDQMLGRLLCSCAEQMSRGRSAVCRRTVRDGKRTVR
jgi:hypothetical protein